MKIETHNLLFSIVVFLLLIGLAASIVIGIVDTKAQAEKDSFEAGYKAACVDFYKGSIKMELKE